MASIKQAMGLSDITDWIANTSLWKQLTPGGEKVCLP
jgi:hypothetical protein